MAIIMIKDSILKKVTKPGRYTGGEWGQIVKNKKDVSVRFAFCFPDTYEIGMSNLGMRILYGRLNEEPDIWCERVFAPGVDMEEIMRARGIPLWALESGDSVREFDILGFTLQYELCYTNLLNLLSLASLPLLASERDEKYPLVVCGGPCTFNAEPVADFCDILLVGDGEEQLPALARLYAEHKKRGYRKDEFLRAATVIKGVYVPSLYEVEYNPDNTIKEYRMADGSPLKKVERSLVCDFDNAYFPEKPVMPFIEVVHDRAMLEVFRGCRRGCRFCQAGMTSRPVRQRSPETLNKQAKNLTGNTGYDEISLTSLSISDYTALPELCDSLLEWTDKKQISLSLPSMRVDNFSTALMRRVSSVRNAGITFAPEAGTQRMRDVINKNITEKDLMSGCRVAFENGKNSVKLYFMNGLPTETDEDLKGIAELAEKVIQLYYTCPNRPKRAPGVTISVACLVPKPFTPFQWQAQTEPAELERRQLYLKDCIRDRKIAYHYHDARVSRIEAALARGSRRLGKVLLAAHEAGMKFDSWDEYFDYEKWLAAFEAAGEDIAFYANREIPEEETLPWDIIDVGVTKEFLLRERKKAFSGEVTASCSENCSACGANKLYNENAESGCNALGDNLNGWEKPTWCPKTQR